MRDNGQVVIILYLPCCAAKRSMGDFYVPPHDTALFAELLIIEAVRDIVCKLFRKLKPGICAVGIDADMHDKK